MTYLFVERATTVTRTRLRCRRDSSVSSSHLAISSIFPAKKTVFVKYVTNALFSSLRVDKYNCYLKFNGDGLLSGFAFLFKIRVILKHVLDFHLSVLNGCL